jgi:hypothetical protein
MSFEPLDYARNEIAPLLRAIVVSVEEEERADQVRFFSAILNGVENARDATDLAEPFMELSMSAFVGFDYSPPTAMLLDQVLLHAGQLSEVLSLDDEERH